MTTSIDPTTPTSSSPIQRAHRVPISYRPQDERREPRTVEEMIELQKLNESAEKFDQLLQVSHKNKRNQSDSAGDESTSYYDQDQSSANIIALSSQAYKLPVESTSASQAATISTVNTDLSELCEKIATKISISGPALNNKEEVRLLLRNDILPQTEIRVSLDAGSIRINFLSGAQDSYNWLINHQESCANYLNNRLAQPISIDVQRQTNDNLADGRSRQRRNLYDEMEKG